ncbi:hypothetical protein IV203_013742 [Nitzschia inconspicua]|uniref:Uncharacterized protein n=1 Tax=Nitzschia inconspicua TaxID=303405 RepID=A0A9K3M620_9STRA|nr:hypothetical protein IV203_013742 [Nitzschia inconspicua]
MEIDNLHKAKRRAGKPSSMTTARLSGNELSPTFRGTHNARQHDHRMTFHSEVRGHPSAMASYMLQDPVAYRKPFHHNGYFHGGPPSESSTQHLKPSRMDRSLASTSRPDAEYGRQSTRSTSDLSHYRLPHTTVPANDLPPYMVGGARGHSSGFPPQHKGSSFPSPYSASVSDTAIAIDAETGRPVRIFTHHSAGYSHLGGGGGASQAHLYPPAPTPSDLSLYGASSGAVPGPAPSHERLRRQTPTLTAAAGGHNAFLVHRPGDALPLYITDPLAPTTDLGRPPSPTPDPYSFSSQVPRAPSSRMEELVARSRLEEQSSASDMLHRRQEEHHIYHPHSDQRNPSHHPLMGHMPSSQLTKQYHPSQLQHQSATRRSLPLHNGSLPPQDYVTETNPVPQDLPDPRPGEFPAVLYCEADEERLTSYQCLLRKQLELFEADEEDVRHSTRQGRTQPIKLGQVGIRCRHCACLKLSSRIKGASYYSQTIEGVYQIAQNMSKGHLCDKCMQVPKDIRRKLNIYRTDCRRAIKGKEYWSEHIRSLGVYEDTEDCCLRLRHPDRNNRYRRAKKGGNITSLVDIKSKEEEKVVASDVLRRDGKEAVMARMDVNIKPKEEDSDADSDTVMTGLDGHDPDESVRSNKQGGNNTAKEVAKEKKPEEEAGVVSTDVIRKFPGGRHLDLFSGNALVNNSRVEFAVKTTPNGNDLVPTSRDDEIQDSTPKVEGYETVDSSDETESELEM